MKGKNKNAIKLVLLLTSSLTIMAGATISPSLPQMAHVFADTPNAVFLSKLILTIPALFIAIWAPFAGRIIDVIGRLKLFYFSLALYAIAGSSGFFLDNLYFILIGRAFLGIAVGGILTIATTLIGDYFIGEERKGFVGYQNAFVGLGGVAFITLGGVLADSDWRYPFLIYSFSLLVLLLAVIYLKEPSKNNKQAKRESISIKGFFESFPKVVLLILASALFSMIFFYIVPTQIPFLLEVLDIKGNSLSGYAIACTTLSGTLASLAHKKILAALNYKKVMMLVFFFMALGFLVVYLTNSYAIILFAMFLVGIGSGLVMPNLNVWLLDSVNETIRGISSGFLTTGIFLGQFLSPILFNPIIEKYGIHFSFLLFAIGCFGITLHFILRVFTYSEKIAINKT